MQVKLEYTERPRISGNVKIVNDDQITVEITRRQRRTNHFNQLDFAVRVHFLVLRLLLVCRDYLLCLA